MNNNLSNREAVIVDARRIAAGKAMRGALSTSRPEDLIAAVIADLVKRNPAVEPKLIDDVIIGCAMPEGEQGLNIGRRAALRAGLPVEVPGETVNRFCSSGLQTIADGAMRIMSGMADVIIAGGVEAMSMVPMRGNKFAPNPHFSREFPEVYLGMGLTAENVAEKYDISREEQDQFATRSHQNAAKAQEKKLFSHEIVPFEVENVELIDDAEVTTKFTHSIDEGVRPDTSMEGLSKLRPVFKTDGTVTAGNSSQMNDSASAVMMMSMEMANKLGLKPLAKFISFGVGGVPPELMGMGPVAAVPKALSKAGLNIDEIDLIELNEAFASQALAVIQELELDLEKVNVNGGAIALGHPLGCTGAKLTTQLIYEMGRRKSKYGLVTMCVGGGMGAAGIFENLQ